MLESEHGISKIDLYEDATHWSLTTQSNWQMDWHTHDFHESVAVIQGGMMVCVGEEKHVVRRGDVLHYQRGVAHREISLVEDPVELYWLAWIGDSDGIQLINHDQRGRLETLMSWAVDDFNTDKPSWESYAQTVVDEHRQMSCEACDLNAFVVRIRQWMKEWHQDSVRLNDLAADMNLSESYLNSYQLLKSYRVLMPLHPLPDSNLTKRSDASFT